MIKLKKLFLNGLILLVIFSLVACNQPLTPNNQLPQNSAAPTNSSAPQTVVEVFFGNGSNEKLVPETRMISFANENEKYMLTLAELFKGATSSSVVSSIPVGTTSYGVIRQNDSLIVDISKEFSGFPGIMAEEFAVGSIVNTMTQFEEIKWVKILIEGEELIALSGMPRGFMEYFSFEPVKMTTKSISLFFADKGANNLIEVKRKISVDSNISLADLARRALEEEIKGTTDKNRMNPLNSKIQVISFKIEGDQVNLDLSKDLLKSCQGTTGETMAVDAIVRVLTNFSAIKKIMVTVEDKLFETGHNIYDKPLTVDNITWSEPG